MEKQVEILLHGGQYKQLMENRILEIREKYGLRKVDIEVLYYLSGCGDRNTSKDICADTKITKGHISQAVDRMHKMKLLTFVPDKDDRRCVHFALTVQADAVVQEIRDVWIELHRTIFEGVTEEEKKVLARVAVKIGKNVEKALGKD